MASFILPALSEYCQHPFSIGIEFSSDQLRCPGDTAGGRLALVAAEIQTGDTGRYLAHMTLEPIR